jgi:ribulose-phosphate 3-epimerase
MPPGRLAASILSADFARLGDQVKGVALHADIIHVDVMDAHFVPPLTIGPVVVESLRPVTDRTLHAHLMVEAPEGLFEDFAAAGTDIVTFHLEAARDPGAVVDLAGKHGMAPGIAVNPETEVDGLFPHLDRLDNVIVMTLFRTGWAGQPFNETMLPKVEAVRKEIDRRGLSVDVVVDGGIDEESGRRCVAAGATVLAAASSVFKAEDPAGAARRLSAVARGES